MRCSRLALQEPDGAVGENGTADWRAAVVVVVVVEVCKWPKGKDGRGVTGAEVNVSRVVVVKRG